MKREHIELLDDIDGKKAGETLIFGLDGRLYSIDLHKRNADKLRRILAPYILAGRTLPRTRVRRF